MLRRSKNRHTALRLPAILRLRIAATISSSVRSGWSAISASRNSACFSSGEVLPPLGFAATLPVCFEALRPNHHHAGADPIAFGRLTPRGTGLNVFNHSGTQVDGIRASASLAPKNESMPIDSLIDKAVGNPPDSSRAKFALSSIYPSLQKTPFQSENREQKTPVGRVKFEAFYKQLQLQFSVGGFLWGGGFWRSKGQCELHQPLVEFFD